MTLRVALHLDGDPAGAKKAINETKTALKTLDHTGKAVTKTSLGIGSGLKTIGSASGALQLNNQQLMNMQFQMSDMAVMLASGQNPFTLIMQQGMQIGGIFGPGATVGQAMKATGAGIISFLTNPINLFIAATAVAAGAIPLLWDAITGPEGKSAKEAMEEFSDFVGGLEGKYDEAAEAAKRLNNVPLPKWLILSQSETQSKTLTEKNKEAIEELATRMKTVRLPVEEWDQDTLALVGNIQSLGFALEEGKTTADEVGKALNDIKINPDTSQSIREHIALLETFITTAINTGNNLNSAKTLNAMLSGNMTAKQLREMQMKFALQDQAANLPPPNQMDDPERGSDLRSQWKREQERLTREQERAAHLAQQQADQREANAYMLGDLQKEIEALSATGDQRTLLLAQLQEEQDIRSAIASLGENATAAEIEQLQSLIPLRNEALERSKRNEEQMRREEQSTQRLASGLAGVSVQLLKGKDAGDLFGSMLERMGSKLLEFGFMTLLGGATGGAGGSLLSMLFSAQGNVFANGNVMAFANGGVVDGPTLFPMTTGVGMMGEAGPEAIMPLKRSASGRLGVEMVNNAASAIQIYLGEGLMGTLLKQARGQSINLIQQATPMIAGQGAVQGAALAQDSYARKDWSRK